MVNKYKKEDGAIELEVKGNKVKKHKFWVEHRRSKNYIAEIDGLDEDYGFSRAFLQTKKLGSENVFDKEDFRIGKFYELRSIYYTGSRNAEPRLKNFFRCTEKNSKIVLEPVSEDELIERYSNEENEKRDQLIESINKKIQEKTVEELEKLQKKL